MRVAFSSMALNTGSSSPGELDMTVSTSEVAVCCSSASESSQVRASSFFSNSRACASSLFISDAWDSSDRATPAPAFVPVERSLRLCVWLFAPLRDKVHLVGMSVDPDSRNHNTVRGRLVILGAQMKRGRPTRPVAWKASGTAIVYVNAAARSVSDGPSLPPPPAAPPRTPGSCSSASPAIERGLAYFKRIASVLAKAALGLRLNEHITADSPTVFAHACKMGLEGTA